MSVGKAGQSKTSSHVSPDIPPCHVLHVAGNWLAQTQGYCSSHDGLHPRPLLMGNNFHELAECRHRSASRLNPRRTRKLPSLWYRENLDTWLKMLGLQWRKSQIRCLWCDSWRRRLFTKVSLEQLAGRRDRCPADRSRFVTAWAVMCLSECRIICIFRRGAELKQLFLTIQRKWRSSRGVDIFCLPSRFL